MIGFEHYLKLCLAAGIIYLLFSIKGIVRLFKWKNKFDYWLYGYVTDKEKSVLVRIAIFIANLAVIFLILIVYELLTGSPLPIGNIF